MAQWCKIEPDVKDEVMAGGCAAVVLMHGAGRAGPVPMGDVKPRESAVSELRRLEAEAVDARRELDSMDALSTDLETAFKDEEGVKLEFTGNVLWG